MKESDILLVMDKPDDIGQLSLEHNPISEVLEIIGDHWTLCVLQETFLGRRRFADIRNQVGIASNILSNRLARLVKFGILEQLPYKEVGQRIRHEYQLTPKGQDLLPALLALIQWGDRYITNSNQGIVKTVHIGCGQEVAVEITCQAGHMIKNVSELNRSSTSS